ncbi:MAG: hypothetical protein H0V01_00080 [Bacteroidetes bacterium]|nr:hypothetical protein [Bacteroidota bacterium]HET6244916.1 hypothetical protein [Bacteroidia bacterium]
MGKFFAFLFFLAFILVLFFIPACKKNQQEKPYLGYDYFPTEPGKWVIYSIDSIAYSDITGTDTIRYELKELIDSHFTDNAGRPSQRILRFTRKSANVNWKLSDVWFSTSTESKAEKVEENIKFVKLIFPVRKGKIWDGNAFNNLGAEDYQYNQTHTSLTINNLTFDSTLTVQQVESFNLIETKNYKERYATGVGLINKEVIDIETEVNGTIKRGFKFNQNILSYGE